MIWKNLLILSFLIFNQNICLAFKVVTYKPIAKYNSTKTCYLASLPQNENSREGYTAVFDSKSNKLLFKIQTYFYNERIFLSNNGEQLLVLESKFDSIGENFVVSVYNKSGLLKSVPLFTNLKTTQFPDKEIHDMYQAKNHLIIMTNDSTYTISHENLKVLAYKNLSSELKNPYKRFKNEIIDNDSLFSIANIKINGVHLIDKLLTDLQMKNPTKEEYMKAGYLYSIRFETAILTKNGEFDELVLTVRKSPSPGLEENKSLSAELKTKILNLIESYDLSDVIPEGLDYWYYSGEYLVI